MAGFQATSIRKSYGGTLALEEVSLAVNEGEIHALLGENGAGKTTLLNILYGLLEPDSGEMLLDGKPYKPRSPREAKRAGVGMVHQHFMLAPTLEVGENILLGENPFSLYQGNRDFRAIRERMDFLGFDFPLEARTDALSVGEMQRVEIFKALWKGARLLALDEPTAVLTPRECESLFELLRRIREQGHSVLFISHKLEEIEKVADRVSVLRRGRSVGCFPVAEASRAKLSRLMIGRDLCPPVKSSTRGGNSGSVV
ncbi:MAG: ATP-binding cassette domain-containing protein, partial [Candidatus Omnitrophica bacterium]|nr:ATP-binding cassette domain-containing protein [Candidatus Omnitrophota bacterium]